jgi:hypothetical protein
MSIRAYAIANDLGIMFLDRQLLVFPLKRDAERKRAELYGRDDFDGDCRIERIAIDRNAPSDMHGGEQ